MSIYDSEIYIPGPGDGQPGNLTLPGSGLAVPAGLEAVLDYRGLLLNVQQNVDRYKITSMDGLFDADIRDTRDPNTADDGEVPYNSFYGGRTITISGTIQTYSVPKLRDMQQALRGAFADIRNEYPLHFRTGDYTKDHVLYCKKIGPIAGIEQQSNMQAARDFQISLRASNPRYLSYYAHFEDSFPDIPVIDSQALATIHNEGNYFAQPIITIFGPTQNGCTIINDDTGESFTIEGIIAYSDYLVFDTAAKSLKNSQGINVWDLLGDDSDYMRLQGVTTTTNGDNHLFYSGDASRVSISWHDSWI